MKQLLTTVLLFLSLFTFSQEVDSLRRSDFVFTPEVMVGYTAEANENFVKHGLQTRVILNLGWKHDNNPQEWASRLKGPRTGLSIGYANFGNAENLGFAITLMPFIEFNAFRKKNLKIQAGMGGTYFNKIYDPISNPNNQAITTDLTWSFRLFMHHQIISGDKMDWRMGMGYYHHSNGHTRLPNQGLNSFLVSISTDIKNASTTNYRVESVNKFNKSNYNYVSIRSGFGKNVFSVAEVLNDKKGVYTLAAEYGKVLNNTYMLGGGIFYRFYQHYYDYIVNNESLVQEGKEYEFFKENPWRYSTNFGLFVKGEVLLNHFGIEGQIGFSFHKPAYEIDWKINQGWDNPPRDIPSNWLFGELDSKFRTKHIISTRLGFKYYLIGTKEAPKNNLYFAFHINTNLGQADFTELSLGYVHRFNYKELKK